MRSCSPATTGTGRARQARSDPVPARGTTAALADSIRNGDTQVAQVHGGAGAFAQLCAIPDVRTARIVTPRVMQVTLRAQQPELADLAGPPSDFRSVRRRSAGLRRRR